MANVSANSRLHLIFVPGFGAFDMLGQLEYYAGTTQVFGQWRTKYTGPWGTRIALHYFDNLPTAGVGTRAKRLRKFITKRIVRNEIQAGDRIALIGHSTGGLDIRHLLLDLAACETTQLKVGGVEDEAIPKIGSPQAARGDTLLDRIAAVVFISVPQRGTNLANWTRDNELSRRALVALARSLADNANEEGYEKKHVMATRMIERIRTALRGQLTLKGLNAALLDINAETALRLARDPAAAADGREALADLELWLGHTHDDFLAIDDLACADTPTLTQRIRIRAIHTFDTALSAASMRYGPQPQPPHELARASAEARKKEEALWAQYGIAVRSYATVSPPGNADSPSTDDRVRSLSQVLEGGFKPAPNTDLIYRLAYRACAAGPFRDARVESQARSFVDGSVRTLEPYENDGIVNTASMLWPNGADTLLIEADHADVIGHYQNGTFDQAEEGRKRNRYDMLGSNSGFEEAQFKAVWEHIFDRCANV